MDPDYVRPAKAMSIIPEPAKAMVQCNQVWTHRLHHNHSEYMVFKGRAILDLDRTTRDRNINWKVIIKSVTLYMIWLDHVPFLIMFGHAPPVHDSINPYHTLPVLIRSIHGSHPSSLPWNFYETTFYTASAFKAVHAIESGFRPSPFSPDHLCVFPRHRGNLGRDHPLSNTIKGSFTTSPLISHKTASLLPSHQFRYWIV